VVQVFGRAQDKVRVADVKQLKADGYQPVLKGSRWMLLKRPRRRVAKLVFCLLGNLFPNEKQLNALRLPSAYPQTPGGTFPFWDE